MITLKSAREIEAMDRAGDFLASIHIGLRDLLKPGVDMWEVEEYVRRRCKEENVLPLQIGVEGSIMDYPYATCCSLNDEVAHAFPRHYILNDGDLLKVDMVVSDQITYDTIASTFSVFLDSCTDITDTITNYRLFNTKIHGFTGYFHKVFNLIRRRSNRICPT